MGKSSTGYNTYNVYYRNKFLDSAPVLMKEVYAKNKFSVRSLWAGIVESSEYKILKIVRVR